MILRRTGLIASVVVLARCGSSPPPPPVLALTIRAGLDQNPDAGGHPAPVAIRVYQLAALEAFRRADIFDLIDRQAETLGGDYVGSNETIVVPGEQQASKHELKPNTRFIGAIALFRAIDHATWRVDSPAAANGTTKLTLATHGTQLIASTN